MISPEPVSVAVAGGVLGDSEFLLQKYLRDESISLWAGFDSDGSPEQQLEAACQALPLPNKRVRTVEPCKLTEGGWTLRRTPENATAAADSGRHYDAVYIGGEIDLTEIERFIALFDEPTLNPWRQQGT